MPWQYNPSSCQKIIMKIKEISLSNFSKYDKVTVSFADNITYLIGKNGSGKSTLGITAIWFLFQGIAEKASGGNNPLIGERFRFIGPRGATAKGEMILYDEKTMAEIKVTRKLTKTGTEVFFEGPEGLELGQAWLTSLFNVFLISPKMFCELSPKDQAKALGIDTKTFDDDIAALKRKYTEINAVYNSYGELPPAEEVKKIDIAELTEKKETIRKAMAVTYRQNQTANKMTRELWEVEKREVDEQVRIFNEGLDGSRRVRNELTEIRNRLQDYRQKYLEFDDLVDFSRLRDQIGEWIKEVPEPHKIAFDLYPPAPTDLTQMDADYEPAEGERVYIKEVPDDTELKAIDLQIIQAGETNRKALLYDQHVEKVAAKDKEKVKLTENKTAQTAKENERVAYIKKFKFPFSNLTVGEDGELLLAGKPIKEPYFSTGEILKVVPILLSTSNPDLKYVFLQDFNLMDEDKQAEICEYLTGKGFQLVVEMVGKSKIEDKNCILLRDNIVVENYEQVKEPELSL